MKTIISLVFCAFLFTEVLTNFHSIDTNTINRPGEQCCKCTPVTPVGNFSLKQFSNTWYVAAKSNPFLLRKQKCNSAKVSAINSTFANYSGYEQNVWTNKPEVGNTFMFQKYDKIPGIVAIGPPNSIFTHMTNYTFVDVDYKNYAVIHACIGIKFLKFESAYILTTNPTPDRKTIEKGKQKLKNFGFKTDHFSAVDQLNC